MQAPRDDNNVPAMLATSNGVTYPVKVDLSTYSLTNIGYEHHEIHAGSHFFICDYLTTGFDLNNTLEFVLTTPNTTKWIHLTFDFASTLGAKMDVYEGASAVVGGTAITPKNNNRNSATVSTLAVLTEPTSITDGTKIAGFLAGANRVSGVNIREKEIMLKQNTTYLIRFTSTANSNTLSYCAEYYEHTNNA